MGTRPAACLVALAACGAPTDPPPPPAVEPACAAGERPLDGDPALGCVAAGIPPERCAEGFESDGNRGCRPLLPAEACAPGWMAAVGEPACREVAPCGRPPWGDIAIEPDAQHVDAGFAGLIRDGTSAKPHASIQAAIDAARAGGQVVIAAGRYAEEIRLAQKPVRLLGRCPALVEVSGSDPTLAAVTVRAGASGSVVSGLALTGSGTGLSLRGAENVTLDRLWIHDTGDYGIYVDDFYGPTSVLVRGTLVESTTGIGVFVGGAAATLEGSVVRDVSPNSAGTFGRGIDLESDPASGRRGVMLLRRSLVERAVDIGIFAAGSDLEVEASVVRDVAPSAADGTMGRGISAQPDQDLGEPSFLRITGSLVERTHNAAVLSLGSNVEIDTTVVRDTRAAGDPAFVSGELSGRALSIGSDPASPRPTLHAEACTIEDSVQVGIGVFGADALLESTLVRRTAPAPSGGFGRAVNVQGELATLQAAGAMLRFCRVEDSHEIAVVAKGAALTVEASAVLRTASRVADGAFGDGIAVVPFGPIDAGAQVTGSLVGQSARAGIASFASSVALGTTQLECNTLHLNGEPLEGDGFDFEDLGGNACGCQDEPGACQILSTGLSAPDPLDEE